MTGERGGGRSSRPDGASRARVDARIARRASATEGSRASTRGVDEARAFPSETLQRERDDRAEEWHDGARDDHGCARDFSNATTETRRARERCAPVTLSPRRRVSRTTCSPEPRRRAPTPPLAGDIAFASRARPRIARFARADVWRRVVSRARGFCFFNR